MVLGGSPWCTLCYADLRPAPVSAYAAGGTAPPADAVSLSGFSLNGSALGGVSPAGERTDGQDATWPCASCRTDVALAHERCPACGAGFLAALAEADGRVRLPVLGDLGALSRRARLTAGLAIAPLVAALILALLAIAGLLL